MYSSTLAIAVRGFRRVGSKAGVVRIVPIE